MNSAIANRISIALSFVGIFVSGVLSLSKILNVPVPCGLSNPCEAVTDHPSAFWFGHPVAYYGLLAYGFFAAVGILRAYLGPKKILVIVPLALAAIGAIIHVALGMYAYSVIGKTCWWCFASLLTMVCLAVTQAVVAQTQDVFKRNETLDLVVIMAFCLAATAGLGFQGWAMKHGGRAIFDPTVLKSMTPEKLAPIGAPSYGNPKAQVTIVAFADFYCPACRQYYPVAKQIVDDSNGSVRLIYRNYPLIGAQGHELSWAAAVLSTYALENGKFWQYADAIEAKPQGQPQSFDDLIALGASVGANVPDLADKQKAYDDRHYLRVYEDYKLGASLGIQLTPTYIILAPDQPIDAVLGPELKDTMSQSRYRQFQEQSANK